MKILSIASAKGGVGKTTTAVHLASGLCREGARCLLVDLDPQGAVAPSLGLSSTDFALSAAFQLVQDSPLQAAAVSACPGLFVIGAHPEADQLSMRPTTSSLRQSAQALQVDFVVLDLAPALEPLTLWALEQSDSVVVVAQATALSLRTLPQLLGKLLEACPNTTVEGLLLNHFGATGSFGEELLQSVKSTYGDWVFPWEIPLDESIQKAASLGKSVFNVDPESPAAQAFAGLAQKIMTRYPIEGWQPKVKIVEKQEPPRPLIAQPAQPERKNQAAQPEALPASGTASPKASRGIFGAFKKVLGWRKSPEQEEQDWFKIRR